MKGVAEMRRLSSFIEELVIAHDIVKCKVIGNKDLGDLKTILIFYR